MPYSFISFLVRVWGLKGGWGDPGDIFWYQSAKIVSEPFVVSFRSVAFSLSLRSFLFKTTCAFTYSSICTYTRVCICIYVRIYIFSFNRLYIYVNNKCINYASVSRFSHSRYACYNYAVYFILFTIPLHSQNFLAHCHCTLQIIIVSYNYYFIIIIIIIPFVDSYQSINQSPLLYSASYQSSYMIVS